MFTYTRIFHGLYRDSNVLMRLSTSLKKLDGVLDAAIMMGTEVNKELMREAGLFSDEFSDAKPDDLCIAVKSNLPDMDKDLDSAIDELFKQKSVFQDEEVNIKTLDMALRYQPDSNIALISVPGQYAFAEAEKALHRNLNVFLFSDNVSIDDELSLKVLASSKGLLLMGPDCGTSILSGVPLGFANEIRSGSIGIVGASGTGIQEVSTIIHKFGGGISHAIGTGGRDLSAKIGGLTFSSAIKLLSNDDKTKVIVLISKPPDLETEEKIFALLESVEKPTVVCFLGKKSQTLDNHQLKSTYSLMETAQISLKLAYPDSLALTMEQPCEISEEQIETWIADIGSNRQYVRGLYTGGTLADEAALIIAEEINPVRAVSSFSNILPLKNLKISEEHSIIDLGDDFFTIGRPHPMIDPSIRAERLLDEINDPSVAIFLFDVVLGWGSHENPAGELVSAIYAARKKLDASNQPLFIASVTGTDDDPQMYSSQVKLLTDAGVYIFPSNAHAACAVRKIVQKLNN